MNLARLILLFGVLLGAAITSHAADLSKQNMEELTVFGLRAMGMNADTKDVKKVLSRPEVEKLVKAGLNLQGRLCARITDIRPLDMNVPASYRVTCITHTGGHSKESYYLEALLGVSYNIQEYSLHLCKVC